MQPGRDVPPIQLPLLHSAVQLLTPYRLITSADPSRYIRPPPTIPNLNPSLDIVVDHVREEDVRVSVMSVEPRPREASARQRGMGYEPTGGYISPRRDREGGEIGT